MEPQHREGVTPGDDAGRLRARDAALRWTRRLIVGVAAGAVALSGALSVVAAQAFKGRSSSAAPAHSERVRVPGPQAIPQAGSDDATPLQPPAQPPAASDPAPDPQVSGGS
jgi:hypothetical protein